MIKIFSQSRGVAASSPQLVPEPGSYISRSGNYNDDDDVDDDYDDNPLNINDDHVGSYGSWSGNYNDDVDHDYYDDDDDIYNDDNDDYDDDNHVNDNDDYYCTFWEVCEPS